MTGPVWERPTAVTGSQLDSDVSADVCVVGGGLAGLTIAYTLARDGLDVVVLDANAIAEAESWRTTAHLVTVLDRGWAEIVSVHGEAHARVAASSHAAAIDRIEQIVDEEGIDCDFRRVDGYLLGTAGDEALDEEVAAARRAGIDGLERLAMVPAPLRVPGACIRVPRQATLDPGRYLRGLAAAARSAGVMLAPYSRAIDVERNGLLRVRTAPGGSVSADAVVAATNAPFSTRVSIHAKQAAYRSYVIAMPIRRGAMADALFWDMDEPFHYVRLHHGGESHDVLVVGGEDHKTGQDPDGPAARFARLESWARARFPAADAVVARWSGQVMESMDGLAYIGELPSGSGMYVVSGDCGNGYTHATIAGMLIPALITRRVHPWSDTYDPGRVRVRALGEAVQENANVAAQLTRWVLPGDVDAPDDVPRGCGALRRKGLVPTAVFRDADGGITEMSAVCPHLGCIVRWNDAEQSWDCPCHGSRFDARGAVLNGPAHVPLAPVDETAAETGEPRRDH